MIRTTINLATRKYPGKGLGTVLPLTITFLSLAVFLHLGSRFRDSVDAVERVEKRMELSRKAQEKAGMQEDADLSRADMAAVSEIIDQRGFSWIEALDNIERALPAGVSLTSIQPSFREGGVKLSGYARDFGALSRFINNLEGLRVYKRVFLVNQTMKGVEGKEAIAFNISVEGSK